MKQKTFAILGAVALCLSAVVTSYGFGEPIEGKCLTKEEAAKIQPEPKGGYPLAEVATDASSGASSSIVNSPYNTSHRIRCASCPRGSLVLDPLAKKVFRKP